MTEAAPAEEAAPETTEAPAKPESAPEAAEMSNADQLFEAIQQDAKDEDEE